MLYTRAGFSQLPIPPGPRLDGDCSKQAVTEALVMLANLTHRVGLVLCDWILTYMGEDVDSTAGYVRLRYDEVGCAAIKEIDATFN